MNTDAVMIESSEVRKLLGAASADACLLYIYLKSGNDLNQAEEILGITASRLSCAAATLRQLGLWSAEKAMPIMAGERPNYSERDVLAAGDTDNSFRSLCGEVQRLMGRSLNTEELKILLGFIRYLGLPADVIVVLICYCKDRARQRGNLRAPSLRTIEKEAYAWAEQGIDTLEEASAYIQAQNVRTGRISKVMGILQIRGRSLTAGEEKYARSWIELGFDDEAIAMAYERTCLNTGGLKWNYMDKILARWHEAGLHTAAQIRSGDRKQDSRPAQRQLDEDERAAIARMLQEA